MSVALASGVRSRRSRALTHRKARMVLATLKHLYLYRPIRNVVCARGALMYSPSHPRCRERSACVPSGGRVAHISRALSLMLQREAECRAMVTRSPSFSGV